MTDGEWEREREGREEREGWCEVEREARDVGV